MTKVTCMARLATAETIALVGVLLVSFPYYTTSLATETEGVPLSVSSGFGLEEFESQECWLDAAQALRMDASPAMVDTCKWMSPDLQKVLALEMTRCHVTELGRPVFDGDAERCDSVIYEEDLPTCLPRLSNMAATAYTNFFTHINLLCTKLLRELGMMRYHEAGTKLVQSSLEAERRIQAMMIDQDSLWQTWKSWEKRLEVQQEDLYGMLSGTVEQTNSFMKPWLDLLNMARVTYSLLENVIRAVGGLFVVWFLTLPRCWHWMRWVLMSLVLFVSFLEVLIWHAPEDFLSLAEQAEVRASLRSLLLPVEVIIYVLGIFLSCCCVCGRDRGVRDKTQQRQQLQRPESTPHIQEGDQKRKELESERVSPTAHVIYIVNEPLKDNDDAVSPMDQVANILARAEPSLCIQQNVSDVGGRLLAHSQLPEAFPPRARVRECVQLVPRIYSVAEGGASEEAIDGAALEDVKSTDGNKNTQYRHEDQLKPNKKRSSQEANLGEEDSVCKKPRTA